MKFRFRMWLAERLAIIGVHVDPGTVGQYQHDALIEVRRQFRNARIYHGLQHGVIHEYAVEKETPALFIDPNAE